MFDFASRFKIASDFWSFFYIRYCRLLVHQRPMDYDSWATNFFRFEEASNGARKLRLRRLLSVSIDVKLCWFKAKFKARFKAKFKVCLKHKSKRDLTRNVKQISLMTWFHSSIWRFLRSKTGWWSNFTCCRMRSIQTWSIDRCFQGLACICQSQRCISLQGFEQPSRQAGGHRGESL